MTAKEKYLSWKNFLQNNAQNEVAAFHRFSDTWWVFNSIFTEDSQIRLPSVAGISERKRVQSFSHSLGFGNNHVALMGAIPSYLTAVQFIAQRNVAAPAWMGAPCRLPTVRVWNLDQKFKDKPNNQGHCIDHTDLSGLLGCLYVVRCNLGHGGKEAGNAFDLSLCDAAYEILSPLLLRYQWK